MVLGALLAVLVLPVHLRDELVPALLSAQPLDDLALGLLSCFLCAIHEAVLFIKCLQSPVKSSTDDAGVIHHWVTGFVIDYDILSITTS
jgi:hypothetical protein